MSPDWVFKVSPDPITGEARTPWKHQLDSFAKWQNAHQYAALWEMGTGKTGMGSNLLARHLTLGSISRAMIVAPARVSYSWQDELRDAFKYDILNLAVLSTSAARRKALQKYKGAIIIMNYEGLVGLEDELSEWLGKEFAVLADESTAVKNPRAQRAKALNRVSWGAKYRYALTGTPMPQGPQDIFGQYEYLDPTIFGRSFLAFRANWMRMGGFGGKQIMGLRRGKELMFNENVYAIADRRTKADCLDMPPKNYAAPMRFELSQEERKVYDQLAKEWVAEMQSGTIAVSNGLTKSLRLAQLCTGFVGDREAGETTIHEMTTKTKLKVLAEMLEELDGKFIIWCAWKQNVRDVMKLLAEHNIKAVDYYSDTADTRANELAFRNDDTVRAFVGTAASGGAGLNLQGPEVKTVIYFSQQYSVFERLQSEDRAHRGNIKHTVTIIDIVARKTVEESVVKALRSGCLVQDFLLQDPAAFAGLK